MIKYSLLAAFKNNMAVHYFLIVTSNVFSVWARGEGANWMEFNSRVSSSIKFSRSRFWCLVVRIVTQLVVRF